MTGETDEPSVTLFQTDANGYRLSEITLELTAAFEHVITEIGKIKQRLRRIERDLKQKKSAGRRWV